ncbi:hypothetical protein [Methanopyrus sp.]
MWYYRRMARGLVRNSYWATFYGVIRVIRDRVLAYVHVTRDGRAEVVVPSRFGPGLRRELRYEVGRVVRRVGPLRLYRRLVLRHLTDAVGSLRGARARGHTAGSGELLAKVELSEGAIVVSLLRYGHEPFALALEFPLDSRQVYVLDYPGGDRLTVLRGESAEIAKAIMSELARTGVEPECASDRP